MTPPSIDRLHDLLARQATEPLTLAEEAELAALLVKWPHVDPEAFELAAAAIELALTPADAAPLPPALAHAVAADAAAYFAAPPARRRAFRPLGLASPLRPRRAAWFAAGAGWAVAASALLAVVLLRPTREPSVAERREQLRPTAARFVNAPGQPAAEVVWDAQTQRGVFEVTGLPPNDPAKSQYQLWLIDADRAGQANDRVDGGVFDVRPDGTALVAVSPSLKVFRAAAFAVTEEPPGGVVVSNVPATLRVLLRPAGR